MMVSPRPRPDESEPVTAEVGCWLTIATATQQLILNKQKCLFSLSVW
jgi:hypothetical protein